MTISLKNRLKKLELNKEIKKELPWDCKTLMIQYENMRTRQEIVYTLAKVKREACKPPNPYWLKVEDTLGLSSEAREFLSLSAEMQGKACNYYYPPKQYTEKEAEGMKRNILERLSKIRAGQMEPIV